GLVLVEALRRAVVTHADVQAVGPAAAVPVVEQHEIDVGTAGSRAAEAERHFVGRGEPLLCSASAATREWTRRRATTAPRAPPRCGARIHPASTARECNARPRHRRSAAAPPPGAARWPAW